jgi:hypothetical protein
MKKAKLVLAAVAVFAVVGGVYASKARIGQKLWFTNGTPGLCNLQVDQRTLAPNGNFITNTYASIASGPCTTTRVYLGQ